MTAVREFFPVSNLAYERSRYQFGGTGPIEFDRSYRLAQLPLVNPTHRLVIGTEPGTDYDHGRYQRPRCSLILPVSQQELTTSPTFRAFEADLRQCSFAAKIDHELTVLRGPKIHATIIGGLDPGTVAETGEQLRPLVSGLTATGYRVLGPFVGLKNTGRIYLPIVPEVAADDHWFGLLQDRLGVPRTDFFAVGYFHFAEQLDRNETCALAAFLADWSEAILLETAATQLQLATTNDDLALSLQPVLTLPTAQP